MKRDPRLQGLSSDHHHALVLARDLRRMLEDDEADAEGARATAETFDREIEPHFLIEDEVLLPALRDVGALALVERTEADHAALRRFAEALRTGDVQALEGFAELLFTHVRFEEAELFPACEAQLGDAVLNEVARRAPHPA